MNLDDGIKELLSQLRDAYKENIDLNFKLTAILLLVVGWFTAKEDPLTALCQARWLAYAAPVFAAAGYVAIVYFFWIIQVRSQRLCQTLQRLGADEELYQRFRITRRMLWVAMLGQLTILVGISYFLAFHYVFDGGKACASRPSVHSPR